MATLTEKVHAGEYVISTANGDRSYEPIVVTGGDYPAGTVLGIVTASGSYTEHDPGAADGSEVASRILFDEVLAAAADADGVATARDSEVDGDLLTYITGITGAQKTTAIAALASNGIIVR